MQSLRILLIPLSWIYGFITFLRNKFFDFGIFKTTEFPFPVISVGNLSAGGTGKTPMVEYLIQLLKNNYELATLSRGYKRKSRGFFIADENSTALDIGDEPMQYKRKFPFLNVVVDANRKRGILQLKSFFQKLDVIILDDAFQHRRIKAGLSIVLTDYSKLFFEDKLLPAGTLREAISGMKRADIILVTKTPESLSPIERRIIIKKINPLDYQKIYFSFLSYSNLVSVANALEPSEKKENYSVLLLCGIANPTPLLEKLKAEFKEVVPQLFPDHYDFKREDIVKVNMQFAKITNPNKIIVTTEKDWMRLQKSELQELVNKLPLFYIPVRMDFIEKEKDEFNSQILNYVRTN